MIPQDVRGPAIQPTEERNAVITHATITSEDHGCLTAWLTLDYGAAGQCFGGRALYLPKDWRFHERHSGLAGHFLWRCMEVAGVTRWEHIVGKTIRVRATHNGVSAIGHIVKDDWFTPARDFAFAAPDRSTAP
jgi:hypothetical protein